MIKLIFSVFIAFNLYATDNTENIKFQGITYPIKSFTDVTEKTYILYETPLSDIIPYRYNAIVMQGEINDPNIKIEIWKTTESVSSVFSTQNIRYEIISGTYRIYSNGRFWAKFYIKSDINTRFKVVFINNGVKINKFKLKIYELQAHWITRLREKKALPPDYHIPDELRISTNIPFGIIRREEWKANLPKEEYDPHVPMRITIHHTSGHYPENLKDSIKEIQFIQDYHQNARDWNDIGYHFLVDPFGNIFEGRPLKAVGAHVKYHNIDNIGISVMGDYQPSSEDKVSTNTLNAIIEIASYLKDNYNISKSSFAAHRDLASTDCPGDKLYSFMNYLRDAIFGINAEMKIKIDNPVIEEKFKNYILNQTRNW